MSAPQLRILEEQLDVKICVSAPSTVDAQRFVGRVVRVRTAMNIGNAVWRKAKDEMGRSLWINLSLARSIRRDPTGRCTWVTFDKEHIVAVEDKIEDLMTDATPQSATRPRDF